MIHDYGKHRPDKIIVLGTSFEIEWNADLDLEFGNCCLETQKIQISKIVNPSFAIDVLLHELMHAIWHLLILAEKEKEERVINSLATGIAATLQANPKLRSFITSVKY